jgi:glycosyltransferase involved in cell wall biosynthesis
MQQIEGIAPVVPQATQRATAALPLLIADGDVPTTQLIARVLRAAHDGIETRYPETLFGTDVRRAHVAISRLCVPTLGWLPGYLAARGIGYVYVLDDNFWAMGAELAPYLSTYYSHPTTVETLEAFIAGARAAVVMSRRLGNIIREHSPSTPIEYLNPPFDTDFANALLQSTRKPPREDGIVRVGYPTTRRPSVARLLEPVVRHLAQRYAGRLAFEFIGWIPDALANVPGVSLLPFVHDYDKYLAFKVSRQWDIGIAPLVRNAFSTCKTSVKYREFGGCRIAGVYGKVPPYTDDVVDGHTGLLAEHRTDAWVAVLERLVESRELRDEIAGNAHADVEARFSQRASVRRWLEIAGTYANH